MFFERKRFYKKKVKIMQNGLLYSTQERLRNMTIHCRKRRTGDAEGEKSAVYMLERENRIHN